MAPFFLARVNYLPLHSPILPMFNTLFSRLHHWLHHPALLGNCLLCQQAVQQRALLCNECQAGLPQLHHPCPLCATPMPHAAPLCGRCLSQPPAWERLRVLADYEEPYRNLLLRLKYHGQQEVATLLGALFAEQPHDGAPPQVLLPVPLHWWRQWRRGYNQAELLAHEISQQLGIPLDTHLLKRPKATPAQARLGRAARQRNVRHAFSLGEHDYQHVALVDDVVTTGATARELTRRLKHSGVKRVEVWAICRTLRHAV